MYLHFVDVGWVVSESTALWGGLTAAVGHEASVSKSLYPGPVPPVRWAVTATTLQLHRTTDEEGGGAGTRKEFILVMGGSFSHGLVLSDTMMHELTWSQTEKLCSKAFIVMILQDYKLQSKVCHRPWMSQHYLKQKNLKKYLKSEIKSRLYT